MIKHKAWWVFNIALITMVLTSCTSNPSAIDTSIIKCCAHAGYARFQLKTIDIPAFLRPVVVSNFNVAMVNLGLQPSVDNAEIVVTLRYEQEALNSPRKGGVLEDRMAASEVIRFEAKIIIDVREVGNDGVVWSGSIQRIHNVDAGEYMHVGRASEALLNAFAKVLDSFMLPKMPMH